MLKTFLIGCAVLVAAGCAGVRSEAPQDEQERTEATNEQARSPEATASEEGRCGGTRSIELPDGAYITNDVPGCPNGGLLSGTDGQDKLYGREGEDEVRGLGGTDELYGGLGKDTVYGGPGNDEVVDTVLNQSPQGVGDKSDDVLYGGPGIDLMLSDLGDDVLYGGPGADEMYGDAGGDVLYGGEGNDTINTSQGGPDKLYCDEGKDYYVADKLDYVDSSCEKKARVKVIY